MAFWKNKKSGQGLAPISGAGIAIIDDELSATSPNPLKNSAITEALNAKYDTDDSASTTINDTDYIPMSDSSGTKKKTLWSTIIAKVKSALATVATSGSYNDLSNKPSLSTVATSGSYNDLSNKPALKTVATSGSYTDLSNRPTIKLPLQTYTIDANYKTSYRTETKGDTNYGAYISTVRTATANVDAAPRYSTGLAWGCGDTHSYLNIAYSGEAVYVGGGSSDKLHWTNRVCLSPFDLAMSGSTYGYKKTDGTFVAFRKPTGNATAAQVLSGYTFSNASSDGLSGSMPSKTNGTTATGGGTDSGGAYVFFPYGYYPYHTTVNGVGSSYVYVNQSYVNSMHKHTDTKTPTGSEMNNSALSLGEKHNYRYVNTAVCYTRGSQHYANNRNGYAGANNASELRFDLYDIKPSTIIRIRTTDSTTSYITIRDGNNSVYVNSQVVDTNHSLSYTIPSSFTNGTICVYARPTSGERNLWYWWTVSNSSY